MSVHCWTDSSRDVFCLVCFIFVTECDCVCVCVYVGCKCIDKRVKPLDQHISLISKKKCSRILSELSYANRKIQQ
jgi:hypothetical protein